MVPYKGRSSLKQYMPKKPVKRGLKVWVRADSVTGYISRFQIYTGKKSTEKGLGARVVTGVKKWPFCKSAFLLLLPPFCNLKISK